MVFDSLTSVGQSVHDGLDAIRQAVTELQVEYNKHLSRQAGKRVRIKWALVNRQIISKQEQRLQIAIGFFNTILSLVQLCVLPHPYSLATFSKVCQLTVSYRNDHGVIRGSLDKLATAATDLEKKTGPFTFPGLG